MLLFCLEPSIIYAEDLSILQKSKEVVETNKDLMIHLYEAAKKVEAETGIPALFQLAQAILESGWDLQPIVVDGVNSYNIFGIKWYEGCGYPYVTALTKEYANGKWVTIKAKFKKYSSFDECFRDHANLLQKSLYKTALDKFKKDGDLVAYVNSVSKVYATDPNYAKKILNIMDSLMEVVVTDYEEEKKLAKEFAVKNQLIKPSKSEDWLRFTTKEELAVILKRFYDFIKEV